MIGLFTILLVVIPGAVYFSFADSTKKSEEGVLLSNKNIFGQEINEQFLFKNFPMMLARSDEFQALKALSEKENELLKKIKNNPKVDELLPKTAPKRYRQMAIKPLLLILAHMLGLGYC